jgi:uncharacterized protein YdaU (DUF1376 family)
MSLPYFPLFPADFDSDTGHLSLAEDGAYNRLLRLQWRAPGCKLPGDMGWIFRKARAVTDEDQRIVAGIIKEFFTRKGGKIYSDRLLKEWVKSSAAHSKRVSAGSKGGSSKALKTNKTEPSNATAMLKQPEPEPEPYSSSLRSEEIEGGAAGTREREAENPADNLHAEVMAAVGLNGGRIPTHWMPPAASMHVQRWVDELGLTPAQILEAARQSRMRHPEPPGGPKALDGVMRTLAAELQAPPLTPAQPPDRQAQPPPWTDPRPRNPTAAELLALLAQDRERQEREEHDRATH